MEALSVYQNQDGGFGHALEADSWNPNSAPVQTGVAAKLLQDIEFYDRSHPIVQGILSYLEWNIEALGHFEYDPLSNVDYPHAGWWQTRE